jgi:ABC-type transport system involved in cytochrome c biogenesis ATPase subunit
MSTAIAAVNQRVMCSDVSLRNGRDLVLRNFSWAHSPPGIGWLIGANGSGKSSLLRALAGWQRPARGGITWSQAVCSYRYYAPVMQAPPEVRVGDFIEFIKRIETDSSVLGIDALLSVGTEEAQRFGRLSTGEAKRLLLWALLRSGDGALLLDEPYEHLSREGKVVLTEVLRARAESRVVIVATNQDVETAANDVVMTMEKESTR